MLNVYKIQGVQDGLRTFKRATVTSFYGAKYFSYHFCGGKMCTF